MKVIALIIVLATTAIGCSSAMQYFGICEDSRAEEAFESWVKYETGIDFDISEQTPEEDR